MMRLLRTHSTFAPVLFLAVVFLGVPIARAQDGRAEGLPAGPWLLLPFVGVQWGYDTNPFYASSGSGRDAETNERYSLGVGAALPFRSSRLRLGYRRDLLRYQKTRLNADTVDDVKGDLDLRFASSDHLALSTSWTEGVADTLRFDPGGETAFRGEPFRLREVSATMSRDVPGTAGYQVRVARRDLNFPRADTGIEYFEYRGWDVEGEYRHPIARTLSGTATYVGRRYRHFCGTVDPSGGPCPDTGTPFREERGDAVLVGLRGVIAERSPFSARAGWMDLRYRGGVEGGFGGLVGDAALRVGFSANAWVEANLTRQVYSSFYLSNNYFTYSAAQARIGANFSDRWEVAAGAFYSRAQYDFRDATGTLRRDDTLRAEAYANLFLPRAFGVRFTVTDDHRSSTIDGLDFDRRTFFVGAFFGWM